MNPFVTRNRAPLKPAGWTGLVLLTVFAFPAAAMHGQTPRDRSVFGGVGQQRPPGPQSLVATLTTSAARDEDFSDARVRREFADLDAAVLFARQGSRFSFSGAADTSIRRYASLDRLQDVGRSGDATLTAVLGRRTTVRARVDGRYVSATAFDLFARESALDVTSPLPAGFADASVDWATTTYGGTVELERVVGRRSSIGVTSGLRWAERGRSALGRGNQRDEERTLQTRYSRSVGKGRSVHLEYSFRQAKQRLAMTTNPLRNQELQLTFESRWNHSTYRRSVLSFGAGPLLSEHLTALAAPVPDRSLRIVGGVAFSHDLTNNWTARASYRRGAGLRDTVAFSNTYAADILGRFGRRVDLTVSVGHSDEASGVRSLDTPRRTSFGSAQLQVGLTEFVAAYAQYYRYHHIPRSGPPVPATFLDPDRQGLRLGVTFWLPLVRR
jgi:hypothetical protein